MLPGFHRVKHDGCRRFDASKQFDDNRNRRVSENLPRILRIKRAIRRNITRTVYIYFQYMPDPEVTSCLFRNLRTIEFQHLVCADSDISKPQNRYADFFHFSILPVCNQLIQFITAPITCQKSGVRGLAGFLTPA